MKSERPLKRQIHFNPRTREGCDRFVDERGLAFVVDFNPRTREGCDDVRERPQVAFLVISIHAPVKGATESIRRTGHTAHLFQSTHP